PNSVSLLVSGSYPPLTAWAPLCSALRTASPRSRWTARSPRAADREPCSPRSPRLPCGALPHHFPTRRQGRRLVSHARVHDTHRSTRCRCRHRAVAVARPDTATSRMPSALLRALHWAPDPVMFALGGRPFGWYALLFVAGLLAGYAIVVWTYMREGIDVA